MTDAQSPSPAPRRGRPVDDETPEIDDSSASASTETDDSQRWRRVSSPESADRPTGVPASPIPGRRRRPARALDDDRAARKRTLTIAAIVSLAVVVVAVVLSYLGTRAAPNAADSATPTPTPATWKMVLPPTISGYSRPAAEGVTPKTGQDGTQTISANYSKTGKPMALVMMSRSYVDLKSFMESANITNPSQVKEAMCGMSGDFPLGACAVMKDDTVAVVFNRSDMTTEEQITLANQVLTYASTAR